MPECFEPKIRILPNAQQEIWPLLSPAARLSFVLYGGTAVALYLGHRISVDFDFFSSAPLKKGDLEGSLAFMHNARTTQESENTLVVVASMPSGPVKVSFFGSLGFGRIKEPRQTKGSSLLVASLEDLLATKLKTILDRAEAKDYRDIAAMLSAGVSFKDGDLPTLPESDRNVLRAARDRVSEIPDVPIIYNSLAVPLRDCKP
jgi:hypothetical protein